jgi:hypothetical protein
MASFTDRLFSAANADLQTLQQQVDDLDDRDQVFKLT